MISKKEEEIFLSYFEEEKLKSKECLRNYKNKKVVFFTKIDGQGYYIKKYIPYKKRKYTIGLGIKEDFAIHYKTISEKLKKLNIPHVEPYYIEIKRYGVLKRASILVTKDSGHSLERYIKNYKEHLEYFEYFFNTFVYLVKNKIYCTDYNPDGILLGNDGVLRLIDFDAYKIKRFITKKFKKYLIDNLKKIYIDIPEGKEFNEYCEKKITLIVQELGWENDVD